MLTQEQNRRLFAKIEARATWAEGTIEPLDAKTHPELHALIKRAAELGKTGDIELYHAPMRIPHAQCIDTNKIVISDIALDVLEDAEAAMYVAHKLGHQFHGFKHLVYKGSALAIIAASTEVGAVAEIYGKDIYPPHIEWKKAKKTDGLTLTRRLLLKAAVGAVKGAVLGGVAGIPIHQIGNTIREPEADREAVKLIGNPSVLLSMLQKLEAWCVKNKEDPESIYPGIEQRLIQARELVKENTMYARFP